MLFRRAEDGFDEHPVGRHLRQERLGVLDHGLLKIRLPGFRRILEALEVEFGNTILHRFLGVHRDGGDLPLEFRHFLRHLDVEAVPVIEELLVGHVHLLLEKTMGLNIYMLPHITK
jgi:hypothetical protein